DVAVGALEEGGDELAAPRQAPLALGELDLSLELRVLALKVFILTGDEAVLLVEQGGADEGGEAREEQHGDADDPATHGEPRVPRGRALGGDPEAVGDGEG